MSQDDEHQLINDLISGIADDLVGSGFDDAIVIIRKGEMLSYSMRGINEGEAVGTFIDAIPKLVDKMTGGELQVAYMQVAKDGTCECAKCVAKRKEKQPTVHATGTIH